MLEEVAYTMCKQIIMTRETYRRFVILYVTLSLILRGRLEETNGFSVSISGISHPHATDVKVIIISKSVITKDPLTFTGRLEFQP